MNTRDEAVYIYRQAPVILVFKILWIEFFFLALFLLSTALFNYFNLEEQFWGPFSALFIKNVVLQVFNIFLIIYIILDWYNRRYTIDEGQIAKSRGIIRRRVEAWDIGEIQSFKVRQGFIGRLFNYGSIRFHILLIDAGVYFKYVPRPNEFAALCEEKKQQKSSGPVKEAISSNR